MIHLLSTKKSKVLIFDMIILVEISVLLETAIRADNHFLCSISSNAA